MKIRGSDSSWSLLTRGTSQPDSNPAGRLVLIPLLLYLFFFISFSPILVHLSFLHSFLSLLHLLKSRPSILFCETVSQLHRKWLQSDGLSGWWTPASLTKVEEIGVSEDGQQKKGRDGGRRDSERDGGRVRERVWTECQIERIRNQILEKMIYLKCIYMPLS